MAAAAATPAAAAATHAAAAAVVGLEMEQRQLRLLSRIDALAAQLSLLCSAAAAAGPVAAAEAEPGSEDSGCTEEARSQGPAGSSSSCSVSSPSSPTQQRLSGLLEAAGVAPFEFRRVPADYYSWTLEQRREVLSGHSVDHLCKSIVMKNTQASEDVVDCSNPHNSLYYVVVIQYSARLNAEKLRNFVHSLNNGAVAKKRFNMRLAPEEESYELSGFEHNAVTPVGMRTNVPVILSDRILQLQPDFFWMGGGEVDLKLGMRVPDFVRVFKPFVADCTY